MRLNNFTQFMDMNFHDVKMIGSPIEANNIYFECISRCVKCDESFEHKKNTDFFIVIGDR